MSILRIKDQINLTKKKNFIKLDLFLFKMCLIFNLVT